MRQIKTKHWISKHPFCQNMTKDNSNRFGWGRDPGFNQKYWHSGYITSSTTLIPNGPWIRKDLSVFCTLQMGQAKVNIRKLTEDLNSGSLPSAPDLDASKQQDTSIMLLWCYCIKSLTFTFPLTDHFRTIGNGLLCHVKWLDLDNIN